MDSEVLLQTVIIIFMLFLCALCLFAVLVIARDIIVESIRNRRRNEEELKEAAKPTETPAPIVVTVPAPAPVVEEKAVEPEPIDIPVVTIPEPVAEPEPVKEPEPVAEPEVIDENAVTFSTSHNLTMEEKYATLSSEFRTYFDDIVRHALAKEGVKENKSKNYYDYKIGSTRLVRIMIKRGEIVCEFIFLDREFRTYASTSNVKMKRSATTIKITEASAVGVAKDGIDLVCAQLAEEREFKKEQARERRRERRRQQAETAAEVETANA